MVFNKYRMLRSPRIVGKKAGSQDPGSLVFFRAKLGKIEKKLGKIEKLRKILWKIRKNPGET